MLMSESRIKVGAAAVALAMLVVNDAHAGPAGATEFTQLLNNLELVGVNASQVQQVQQLIKTYQTHLQQLQQLKAAGLKLPKDGSLGSVFNVDAELMAVSGYYNALSRANASTDQLRTIFKQRSVEAGTQGLTMADYVKQQKALVDHGNKRAQQRLQREDDVMSRVNGDYQYAKQMGEKIQGTEGVHQAVVQLGMSMNKVIQQNARLQEIMAYQTGTKEAAEMQEKSDRRNRETAFVEELTSKIKDDQKRQIEAQTTK